MTISAKQNRRPLVIVLALLPLVAMCACLLAATRYVLRYQALSEADDVEFALTPAHRDVAYCTLAGATLELDLYAGEAIQDPAPVVVYVHGGSFVGGDKAKGSGLADLPELVARGYVVASVNYRLAPDFLFPAPIQDVKCAVRFLRAHAPDYHLDPERIGALGSSAGGNLVSLLDLTDGDDGFDVGEYLDYSSHVSAVAAMFGPANLAADDLNLLQRYLRRQAFGTWDSSDPLLAQASPVSYMRDAAPPFLIVHGDHDDAVPLSQSQTLYAYLQAAGVPAELHVVENANHNFAPTSGPISPTRPEITRLVADFFDDQL